MQNAFLIAVALVCSGCAATSAEYEQPPLPIASSNQQVLNATIATESYLVAGTTLLETPGYFGVASAAEQGLRDSGWFRDVVLDSATGDIVGTVTVKMFQTEMRSGFLALITGFLYPGNIEFRVDVSVRLLDSISGRGVAVARSSSFRAWYELFLLPLMFTHSPGGLQLELARGLTAEAAAAAAAELRALPHNTYETPSCQQINDSSSSRPKAASLRFVPPRLRTASSLRRRCRSNTLHSTPIEAHARPRGGGTGGKAHALTS